jgi:hypothetical protein
MDTLARLSKVLEAEQAMNIQAYITRIRAYSDLQAKAREGA